MYIRKLNKYDEIQLNNLIFEIEDNLLDKTFWLPITDIAKNHFLDDEWTYFLGMFDKDKLIGAVGLFLNKYEYSESCEAIHIQLNNIAEYGRAMVSPIYRNKGIMLKLSNYLIQYAKEININKLIATVHPNNIASQTIIEKVGFIKQGFIIKYNKYPRNIFTLDLK